MYDIGSQELVVGHTEYVAINETRRLEDNGLLPVAYSGVTTAQNFYWSSTNANIAKVDSSTGTITGVNGGTATIQGSIRLGTTYYTISYTVKVSPIEDGFYYMLNKESDKFVDIYDQIMADGTVIHQWEAHGGATQKWQFTYVGDGYYTIKSASKNSVGYYLSVSGNSTANDVAVVLKSGNITDGMKWRIEKTSSGALKLTPKTGARNNRVLSLEVGTLGIANYNGVTIQQRDYVDDTNYKDEWELMKLGNDVYLLGIRDNSVGHYHTSSYIDVMRTMQENGIDSFNIRSTNEIDVSACKNTMADARFVVVNSHGGSDAAGTHMLLSDNNSNVLLRTQDIYDFDNENVEERVKCNFEGVEVVIFVGCETANHSDRSLLHAAVMAGAKYAIGFEKSIFCSQADRWTEYFWKYYFSGEYTVEEAANAAANWTDILFDDNTILSVRVVSRD